MRPTRSGVATGGARSRFISRTSPLSLQSSTASPVVGSVGIRSGDGEIDLDAIASELNDDLLALRGPAPSLTGDAYIDRARQDMTRNKDGFARKRPVKLVLAQLLAAAIDPRVPDERVKGWLDQLWEVVRLRRREISHEGMDAPSALPLVLRAMRSESAGNEAEVRHMADPSNAELLADYIAKTEKEIADDQRLVASLREARARMILRAQPTTGGTQK